MPWGGRRLLWQQRIIALNSTDSHGSGLSLQVREVRKQFGQTRALNGLSFTVGQGETHAVLGENGAGKSTLVKLLSGLIQPDSGEVLLSGERAGIGSPRAAHRLGVRTAFQEVSLVKDLTVAENFLLMEEPIGWFGTIRRRAAEEQVRAALGELGLGRIDPRVRVDRLDLPTRQRLEIARAVSRVPRLLLLDEPTASLLATDVVWLGDMIARVRQSGTTIILISHRMQDVRDFCTKLTVLRNGVAVGTHGVEALSDEDVIELMIGRSLDAVFPEKPQSIRAPSTPALEVCDFVTEGVGPVSFALPVGRIVGVAGLQGMGQKELFLGLFGAQPKLSGQLLVNGVEHTFNSPADAIGAGAGISLIPEERKSEGLFLDLDGRENTTLPSLAAFAKSGLIDGAAEQRSVLDFFQRVNLSSRATWTPVRHLSGGNQQKVIFAKWLMTGGRIMLLYDPTRGVDVGTKAEIYRIMRDHATSGGAALFYSTDITELVNLCDDVIVLYRGRIVRILSNSEVSDTNIMQAAVGHVAADKMARNEHRIH